MHENIAVIPNVKSWAKEAGVSREWLYKSVTKRYGRSPKVILREVRYRKVVQMIRRDGLEAFSYGIAVEAGLRDAAALSKFLSSHFDTNFTRLKEELLKNGDL